MDPASFCLIPVNGMNIQLQKTLNEYFESFKAITVLYIRILRVYKKNFFKKYKR